MSAEFAGALTQRVAILRRSADRDDLGGAAGDWSVVAGAWAALEPITAAAWGEGDLPTATPRWRAVLRVGADVAPGDRLQWRLLLLTVRTVGTDPAWPDRIALTLEEDR
ncbi:head-tail adaptor protein [Sphingomonas sp. CGMCC 1.13654]|uniref:Head-tail adaptor protein n=1 Tax=Sphingomonas chungangi TaxID=2683589 RepID=A0A838L0X0_9SPHN|nr:head-tail adaptor protein [Sphingomonas chungangi]MBA2932981.1 head-tail adaptor protein [Sphingomonas chungangi]MVW56601.1 head-tail adaptor protein [Sphingomonas chungangi]